MIGKKGAWGLKVIAGAILIILSFSLIAYWVIFEIKPETEKGSERAICRASVDMNAKRFEVGGFDVIGEIVDVNCGKIPVPIKGDKEEVFGQLADHMVMAWHDLGYGEEKMFEDDTAVFCLPRYAPIKFEDEDKIYPNFYAYLANEKPLNSKKTYAEILMNRPLTSEEVKEFNSAPDFVNSNVDYAIIFTMAKASAMNKFWASVGGTSLFVVATAMTFSGVGLPAAIVLYSAAVGLGGGTGFVFASEYNEKYVNIKSKGVLDTSLTSSYVIGSFSGDGYVARLWLLPYEQISELNCDKLKLKRYT